MNGLPRLVGRKIRAGTRAQADLRLSDGYRFASPSCAAGSLGVAALHAQKAPHKATAASDAQQPAGAQVHTGTGTGLDTETRLLNMLADHQFIRLEGELDQLPPWQAQFYRGILANRDNDLKKSIELLEPLVDQVSASGKPPARESPAQSPAEDYLREGDWAKAAEAYATLEARLGPR